MTPSKNPLVELLKTAPNNQQVISSPLVADRFVDLYMRVHGVADQRMAEAFYEAEKYHFLKLINDSANISACTRLSLYGIFMDVAVSGLSFDPSMKHLYIVPYNVNIGTKDQKVWEKRAALQIAGPGELLLRVKQGQIKYVDNPIVVFEGDYFQPGLKDGKTYIEYAMTVPRTSDKIIGAFIRITRADDTIDFKVLTMEDIQNLRKFSKDPDSLAWTTGMKGMVEAKIIKHAFKNYPKARVGKFSEMASDTVERNPERVLSVDYGIEELGNITEDISHEEQTQTIEQSPVQQMSGNGITREQAEAQISGNTQSDDFDTPATPVQNSVNHSDDDF